MSIVHCYPNPFNSFTRIHYSVQERSQVGLTIYNTLGQKVVVLANEIHIRGSHSRVWRGRDARGLPVPSGVYLYRLQTDGEIRAGKVLLLR